MGHSFSQSAEGLMFWQVVGGGWSWSSVQTGSAYWGTVGKLARVQSTFQSAASALGLGTNRIVVHTVRAHFVSYSPPVLPIVRHTGFQNQLRGLIFQCWTPGLRCPIWGLNPLLLKGASLLVIFPSSFGSPTGGVCPD